MPPFRYRLRPARRQGWSSVGIRWRPMRPSDPVGSPPPSLVQVSPAFVDFQTPEPGPALVMPSASGAARKSAAYMTRGSLGAAHELGRSGERIGLEDVAPGATAIGRLEDVRDRPRAEQATRSTRRDDVVVRRINHDACDVVRFLEPHLLPRLSTVGGLVDAVAERGGLPIIDLTSADPDEIGIRSVIRRPRRSTSGRRPERAV